MPDSREEARPHLRRDAAIDTVDDPSSVIVANLLKSRSLAQMAHELRTPMNAIIGFSEMMKSEIFGAHAIPAYKEYSAIIHNSGVHLLNLINEIVELSRIDEGAVTLVNIVNDCHHLMKLSASSHGITINEVFEQGMPRIWGDERAIRQIVLNLLSNAIKFTPQGGDIWLKVGWTASGGQYLSVKDTGSGIAEEEIPIVLASFGWANSMKSAEQGARLGLPIAKSLIDIHGGTLTLESKLHIGTEVTVSFPPERVMSALVPIADDPSAVEANLIEAHTRAAASKGDDRGTDADWQYVKLEVLKILQTESLDTPAAHLTYIRDLIKPVFDHVES
jgi:two-component system cell cycle sensor histidine kinase PleC